MNHLQCGLHHFFLRKILSPSGKPLSPTPCVQSEQDGQSVHFSGGFSHRAVLQVVLHTSMGHCWECGMAQTGHVTTKTLQEQPVCLLYSFPGFLYIFTLFIFIFFFKMCVLPTFTEALKTSAFTQINMKKQWCYTCCVLPHCLQLVMPLIKQSKI